MNPLPHAGRSVLVTGAASGIGRRIAEHFALAEGAQVAVLDCNAEGAHATVADIQARGGQASAVVCDLRDVAALKAALAQIDARLGAPAIVVNNAGIAATMPALEYPFEHWQETLAVNLNAPFLISQHVLHAMKARRWGRIVNIASISGIRAGSGRVAYGSSKAALIGLTKQFAIECAEWGVTVNAVAPGPVDTPLVRALHGGATRDTYGRMVPMNRYGSTDEVARAVAFLASEHASYTTGHTLAVDGGFTAAGLLVRDMFAGDAPGASPD